MNNLVSIILPVYNGEKYLCESIDSVLAQTYTNWELIIVDDCSTDSSPDISKAYAAADPRIHYYRNEQNLRLPRNLNRGFTLAKGNYLTWTSDDNRYRPTAIERMINELQAQRADFVFASCRIIDGDGKAIEYIMVNENSHKRIVGENPVGACFMYTRRAYETVGEYDPDLTLVEDFDYWQRIYAAFGAVTISDILYDYRWHDGALTSTMKKDQFNQTLEKMLLQNRPLFGKLTNTQNYYYYAGLYNCKANLGVSPNPYIRLYKHYSNIYLLQVRIPNKLKRMFKRC